MILLAPQTAEQSLAHTQGRSQGLGSFPQLSGNHHPGLKDRLSCFGPKDPQRAHPWEAIGVPRSQRRVVPPQSGVGWAAAGNYRVFTWLA